MIGCIGIGFGLLIGYVLALWDYRRDRRFLEAQMTFWRERAVQLQHRLNCR